MRRGHPAAPAWSFVPAIRSAIGVAALWATFCVVLLAAGWLSHGVAGGIQGSPAGSLAQREASTPATDTELKQPSRPVPEAPASEPSAKSDKSADPESDSAAVALRLRRSDWVAVIPLWPADALRWQRMEPSLRLNPGHAPPTA